MQQPDLTFRFVSERRYMDFWTGRGALPQGLPGEVRSVEVILHLEEDRAGEVIHVDHRRYPVLPNGWRERASFDWEMTLILRSVGSGPAAPLATPTQRRRASRQHEVAFRWIPTPDEARAIADMVSRRANQSLLGGNPLRLIRPRRATGARARRKASLDSSAAGQS